MMQKAQASGKIDDELIDPTHSAGSSGHINQNGAKIDRDEDKFSSVNEDETSSSGSSEVTDDEEDIDCGLDEDGEQLPLRERKAITHPGMVKDSGDPDIQNRLTSFFSQLAEQRSRPSTVDEVIEQDSDSGFEDDDGNEGQQYIELDLAMGVLSEEPEGKQFDNVDLPTEQDHEETSDSESEPLQRLTSIAKGDQEILTSKSSKSKKRKIEELG